MSAVDNDSSSSSNHVLNDYDPAILARYIHYYKTGRDCNEDDKSTATNTTTATTNGVTHTKQKKPKTKHVTPSVLELRRSIQVCCRDNTLHTALTTFHDALCNLIHIEPQTFYQLLNLCEGTFTQQRGGVVHVGTPRFTTNPNKKKKKNDTKNNITTMIKTDYTNLSTTTTTTEGGVSSSSVTATATAATAVGNDELTIITHAVVKQLTLKQRLYHANEIYQIMVSLNIPLIEQAYTALIRLASRIGDLNNAAMYLNMAEETQQCKGKLRMYSSLLRAYCGEFDNDDNNEEEEKEKEENYCMTTGVNARRPPPLSFIEQQQQRLIQTLTLWKRMYDNSGGWSTGHPNYCLAAKAKEVRDGNAGLDGTIITTTTTTLFGEGIVPKITLTECEYCAIMKLATQVYDSNVMERIVSDVADTILIPGLKTTNVILQWFRCQSNNYYLSNNSAVLLEDTASAIDHVTLPPRDDPCLGSVTSAHGWIIYVNSTIDVNTGMLVLGPRECNTTSNNENSTAHTTTTTIDDDDDDDDDNNKSKNYQYRLKPVGLTSKSWLIMREMNKKIVLNGQVDGHVSQYQGGGKGKKRSHGSDGSSIISHNNQRHASSTNNNNINDNIDSKQWRTSAWNQFETFIQHHPPYNIVIDGANVGYYEQNFGTNNTRSRHVDYRQIDWLVRHLLEKQQQQQQQQQHIILFLHERHFSNKLVPDWAYPIIQSWDSNQVPYNRLTVYRTPTGMNDDWFWMHAALIHGGDSSINSSGCGGSSSGGGGGTKTSSSQQSILAITNDEMRDHHFQMLAEGSFLRWKERHQVHFDFGSWNKELNRRDVLLQYPSSYSRRIQRVEHDNGNDDDGGGGKGDAFVIPLPKKGDERRFADGVHVAEDGVPDEEMYMVIQRVTRCKTKM